MAAPRDIIDALDSVVSIYFSDVRHKQRAAFILADELIEMTCKSLAKSKNPTLGHIRFKNLLEHPSVNLHPKTVALGGTLNRNHETRNNMQHGNAAYTVDDQHCADAILDAGSTLEHCFPGSNSTLPDSLKVSLRVIRLHSSQGNLRLRGEFEEAMRKHRWNGSNRRSSVGEPPIAVGIRRYWSLVLPAEYAIVEYLLNRISAP